MNKFRSSKINNISAYLPHQKPMLMADLIDEISTDKVITHFKVLPDNIFVIDGVFQESGLIENAAQTCSAIVGQNYFFDDQLNELQNVNVIGFISAIKKIELFELPKVNSQLVTTALLESYFEGDNYKICSMQITIESQDKCLLKGSMNLFLQKKEV